MNTIVKDGSTFDFMNGDKWKFLLVDGTVLNGSVYFVQNGSLISVNLVDDRRVYVFASSIAAILPFHACRSNPVDSDFCSRESGHAGPHRDEASGITWNAPS